MSVQPPASASNEMPAGGGGGGGARTHNTPQQQAPSVFLPSTAPSSASPLRAGSGGATPILPHPFRRSQFERASVRLPSSPQHRQLTITPPLSGSGDGGACSTLARLAPHSPAITRASLGASPRQLSASMRGTPAAQRMHSASYSVRSSYASPAAFNAVSTAAAAAAAPAKTRCSSFSPSSQHPDIFPSGTLPASSLVDSPLYYVVGGAVVNPQLTVSPSVQCGIRGVSTLAALPDATRRPGIGPQLHNTHSTSTAPSSSFPHGAGTATSKKSNNNTNANDEINGASRAGDSAENDNLVVCVEAIRNRQPNTPDSTPYVQQAQEACAGSLAVLRQLYGTTAEDVIEVARTNPRSGTLEPPRLQYHTAQELLPELSRPEVQLKAMANARRRIGLDVSIPTAATLPPPIITFTTTNATPVTTLSSVMFTVDTNTLVMQRDYAAEKAMPAANGNRVSALGEIHGTVATAVAATNTIVATPTQSTINAVVRTNGTSKAPLFHEEKVGLDISREDRIGSSGLYRIRHLVGLRQGLGEMVGLDRVMEYDVTTTSPKLFLVQPSIDASTGDLLIELNTSLQGTAKLVITGVDCGNIDAETGDVQRSSNTLACYITLSHNTSTGLRDRGMVSVSLNGSTQYAYVPSAATRSPSAGSRTGVSNTNSGSVNGGAILSGSANARRDDTGTNNNNDTAGSDGFALTLAHFSQEFAAADRPSSRNLSLSREVSAAAAVGAGGGALNNNAAADATHRYSLDVQSIVARTAALGELGANGGNAKGSLPVSGAYVSGLRSPASSRTGGRRPRTGGATSSRDASGGLNSSGSKHYLFPLTNPHDLRYRHYTEAVRLCRLQHIARQQEHERQEEAQRLREALPTVASKPVPSASNTSMINIDSLGHQRNQIVSSKNTTNVNVNNWSDDDDDEDRNASREPSEESQSRSQGPVTTTTSTGAAAAGSADKKRSHRKSVVEILELEEEFDHNNPVAMPTVTGMASLGSGRSSNWTIGTTRRIPSTQRLRSEPLGRRTAPPSLSEVAHDATAMRELRRPCYPSTLFCTNALQSPVSYLRLTVWQDRLLLLFTEEDKELLRSEQRARFKREARQELTEGSLAGMLSSTFAWSTNPSSSGSIGGRKLSMQGCRASAVFTPRNISAVGGSGAFPAFTSKGGGGSTTSASSERPFAMVRRLILCLALEEERSSVQLYADVVQLCSHLCHSALLKTMALTRGTRDGLQQAAAAVLATGPPTPSPKTKASATAAPVWRGGSTLSASDREALRLLIDTLELALTVTLLLGAYTNAVEYAVQRVHALCLLEGDTTAAVNAAQRDLVEAYLFYGDYATALTIAEDVVMLTEQLCLAAPDAYEVAEAEALCTLACCAAGRRDRLAHYVTRLEMNVLPIEDDATASVPLPLLQAQLRLVLSYAKMNLAHAGMTAGSSPTGMATPDIVVLVREAVHLLRGDGDLQEMEQSFSTVFPSQARLLANLESSNTNIPLSVRGRLASMVSCSITAGPLPPNRSATDLNGSDAAVKKIMAAQKRLRWNLLSFAGALLVENDEIAEGIEVMENTVKELVLGQHRYVERNHRASIAAILWVGLLLSKSWAQPDSKEDFAAMLKEVANRVVRIKGPLHPFAAAANLQYANVAHHSLNSRHGLSLVSRSLSVLESAVSPQSHYLLVAHYVFGSMAESQQRWRPALEHLSAAYAIAQASHMCDRDLQHLDTRFIGALLNCPPTAVIDVDTTALRSHIEGRLARVRQSAGPHSDSLVEPLWNMAEVQYLLKQPVDAVTYLQEAVRLLDRRGILSASANILRPVDVLQLEEQQQKPQQDGAINVVGGNTEPDSIEQLVQQRNALVQTSFDSVSQALRLATTLYMLGAVFESQARTAAAQENYGQCLALLESVQLGTDSLPAARVMKTIAKLLYTTANCGDALYWSHKAELLLHIHYRKQWPLELESAEKLVAIVERRLYEDEGTYVVQSDCPTQDGLPQLL